MAEFIEIMKQAHRLCGTTGCNRCPIVGEHGVCLISPTTQGDYLKAERCITGWAAAHPEPTYPSWFEFQEATFPTHTRWICPMMFGVECPSKSATTTRMCTACRNRPIPAEIAKKLGIKPITQGEQEENENA